MPEKTLLMIDDNPAMLSAAESALQGIYKTVLAKTGKGGVEAFKICKPDAVILDLRLPDIDGIEVLLLLKSIDPAVPVIMLTAVHDSSIAAKAIKSGAFNYLEKPTGLRSLLLAVQDATDRIPLADGIILPSSAIRNVFQKLTYSYANNDATVLWGEKGVGKRSLSRAVHKLCLGSEHSFLLIDSASSGVNDFLNKGDECYSTVCLHTTSAKGLEVLSNPNFRKKARKVIVVIETPASDNPSPAPDTDKALFIPSLRARKDESFALLSYWHQRLAPEKLLDPEAAEFYLQQLESEGFPENITCIVNLARRLVLK